jgi:tetratricopeptide (TPR) repeat protein
MMSVLSPARCLSTLVLVLALGGASPGVVSGQAARISEETRVLRTYPFSEPNPIPILTRDSRLYPYHSFEGYSHEAVPREWTVVHLENELIEVWVLPEVGGKVWGARVKSSGHEFIYRNEVLKFRNIALRGPWTSGGIEFNFGVIGHTPATATPVDYVLRENPDGSVSCIVGTMDLPSRTHWRVEVRLPPDRAYFETRVTWQNPTVLEQPYYNWMTAAAFAREDLELAIPGNAYLTHPGNARAWPVDSLGRDLSLYRNNTFEGHKSYHVVGELNDFFGGYYGEAGYGFGHWARYEEMPGQKLWLWALSREGGVWEDLLTDTDGQYVEFQAGRLLVQYSPDGTLNPITQAGFDPGSSSSWSETWFPVEGLGGLSDASREGAMAVHRGEGGVRIAAHAFGDAVDTLSVRIGEELVERRLVTLKALEPLEFEVEAPPGERVRVALPALGLDYDSDPSERLLSRPSSTSSDASERIPAPDRAVFQARELVKARLYADARPLFQEALRDEPWNREALLGMADLEYRSARYEEGLEYVNRALELDAYDARANFQAGVLYRASGKHADARDAFGWASRSMQYRSVANVQLAELALARGDLEEASRYGRVALEYDRRSISAWHLLAVTGRRLGESGVGVAEEAHRHLEALDPLGHLVRAEHYLAAGEGSPAEADRAARVLTEGMRSEYPDQELMELALRYASLNGRDEARRLLELGPPEHPLFRAWRAFLGQDPGLLGSTMDPSFAFPFRPETLEPLRYAADEREDWAWDYLLALNLWALDRTEEASRVMDSLGQRPDYGPFYAARAALLAAAWDAPAEDDLRRAVEHAPEERVLRVGLVRHLQDSSRWEDALRAADAALVDFPGDFNLALLKVRSLNHLGRGAESVEILAAVRVLPSENARESHRLYEQAHVLVGLDALEEGDFEAALEHLETALEWPEHLGQGRPYEPEERVVRFLLGVTAGAMGDSERSGREFEEVVTAPGSSDAVRDRWDLLAEEADRRLREGAAATAPRAAALRDRYPRAFDDLDGEILLRALTFREGGS